MADIKLDIDLLNKTGQITGETTLVKDNWQQDSTEDYPFYYDLVVTDVLDTDRPDIIFSDEIMIEDKSVLTVAEEFGICESTESMKDKIRIRSADKPTVDLPIFYWIFHDRNKSEYDEEPKEKSSFTYNATPIEKTTTVLTTEGFDPATDTISFDASNIPVMIKFKTEISTDNAATGSGSSNDISINYDSEAVGTMTDTTTTNKTIVITSNSNAEYTFSSSDPEQSIFKYDYNNKKKELTIRGVSRGTGTLMVSQKESKKYAVPTPINFNIVSTMSISPNLTTDIDSNVINLTVAESIKKFKAISESNGKITFSVNPEGLFTVNFDAENKTASVIGWENGSGTITINQEATDGFVDAEPVTVTVNVDLTDVQPVEIIKTFMSSMAKLTKDSTIGDNYKPEGLAIIGVGLKGVYDSIPNGIDKTELSCISNPRTAVESLSDQFLQTYDEYISNGKSGKDFLLEQCDINLDNSDTGSIIGSDVGATNPPGYDDKSIMPEDPSIALSYPTQKARKFLWENFNGGSYEPVMQKTDLGTFLYPPLENLTSEQQTLMKYVATYYIPEALKLIKRGFGLSITNPTSKVNQVMYRDDNGEVMTFTYPEAALSVDLVTTNRAVDKGLLTVDAYGSAQYNYNNNTKKANSIAVTINDTPTMMERYILDDTGSKPYAGNNWHLDRTIVHEIVHGVMAANIIKFSNVQLGGDGNYFLEAKEGPNSNYWKMPMWFIEGSAELIHGIDDKRRSELNYFISQPNSNKLRQALAATNYEDAPEGVASTIYTAGYIFLRYFIKRVMNVTNGGA